MKNTRVVIRRGFVPLLLAAFVSALLEYSAHGQLLYANPGWNYLYDGSWTTTGNPLTGPDTGGSKSSRTLDGTWSANNGSSEWDGQGRGPGSGATGGISSTNGLLTIEDVNNGSGTLNNRKIYFEHPLTNESITASNVLDAGITISFRARLTQPGIVPAPDLGALPDGWGIFSAGKGDFGVHQLNRGTHAQISFSLVRQSEPDNGFNFNSAGLTFPRVTTATGPTGNGVDSGGGAATNPIVALDPNVFHEFWITIQTNQFGTNGTHTIAIYFDGALTPAYSGNVTAGNGSDSEAVPVSTFISMGHNNSGGAGAIDVDYFAYKLGVIAPSLPGPSLSAFSPANNAVFYSGNLSFVASGPAAIQPGNIHLALNGIDVSSSLVITGDPANRLATYSGLQSNTIYTALATVTDDNNRSATNRWTFNTLSTLNTIVIEAEDYNFGSGGDCSIPSNPIDSPTGGEFINQPAPGQYSNLVGAINIDYSDTALARGMPGTNDYRPCDYVSTRTSGDILHPPFVSTGVRDYEVWQIQAGEWLNYTRTVPSGNYSVYLRAASTANNSFRLDKVSGDPTTANQTASPAGSFLAGNSAGAYRDIPLTDAFGSNAIVSFDGGPATVRLTAVTANNDVQPTYLVLVPVTVALPPTLTTVFPAAGSTNVYPDEIISATIANGDTQVNPLSIVLKVNGVDVTSSATITPTSVGASIVYDPPGFLSTNTAYTVFLQFTDNAPTPHTITNTWTFSTIPALAAIPSSYATAPGSGADSGFNIKVRKAPNTAPSATFVTTLARAEEHLADLIIDPNTGLPYVNEAGSGATIEPGVLNYEQSGGLVVGAGAFHATNGYPDAAFPLIPVGDSRWTNDPNFIALEATAYLELTNGIYRFGVRSDDDFKVTVGPMFSDTNLVLGFFSGGRGDAATEFEFEVLSNGVYGFRLIYDEGGGGASLEFYSVNRTTGTRTLINDALTAGSVKAYRNRTGVPAAAPPVIQNISPANHSFFLSTATALTFDAVATAGNTIDPSGIHVSINGVDVSSNLVVGGTTSARAVSWGGVQANQSYLATISVTDVAGHTATTTVSFDTFDLANAVIIEAEDYNFADTQCPSSFTQGGAFIDNPPVDGYFSYTGIPGIDYFDTLSNVVGHTYRPCDYMGTQVSLDALRPAYANTNDFQLWQLQPGDWANYTRTFNANTYRLFARVSSSAARTIALDLVTGDPTVVGQTTARVGLFRIPNTGGAARFQYVAATDAFGNPIGLSLADFQTLRLAALDVNNDVQVNFLLLQPTAATHPSVVSIAPENGVLVQPDAIVAVQVANGTAAMVPASFQLRIDGIDVAGESVITSDAYGLKATYTPPTFWQTGSVHTVQVLFTDSTSASLSNQWSFSVAAGTAGIPVYVNFAAGAGNSAGNPVAPLYPGYLQDIGQVYGDRGNGFTYGWSRDVVADGRYRQSGSSPDLRWDTLVHLQKATPAAIWEVAIPNGTYSVHAVGGDPTATDSIFQFTYDGGVTTPTYTPVSGAWWCNFTNEVTVTDGKLTVSSGPSASNNKISFIDIVPAIQIVAPTITRQPTNLTVTAGSSATFRVSVRGTDPLYYQWLQDGNPISGATGSTYTIANAQLTNAAAYSVTVTNEAGSAASASAQLTVNNNAPEVRLAAGHSGTNFVLSWPNTAPGFTVIETTNLTPPVAWTTNTLPVVNTNGAYEVTIPAIGTRYFRLVQ